MRRGLAAAACLAVTAAAIFLNPRLPGGTHPAVGVALIGLAWLSFAVGAWLVLGMPVRVALALILAGGVVLQIAAGIGPARSSDDLYRYIWDGRVQASGVDPYRYAPAAPELADLRDEFLWPTDGAWCVPPGAVDAGSGAALLPGCTRINRAGVHTIYPPVAEAIFYVVRGLSPPGSSYGPIQVAASIFALAAALLLVIGLRRLGLDPRRAVLWAWCPAVAIEAGSNAHIDVAGAGLTAAALLVLASSGGRRATGFGGALLGLAIATKVTPVLVLPSVLRVKRVADPLLQTSAAREDSRRRRPLEVVGAAAAAVAAVYLPHLLAVGGAVIGYLPGYLHEEGYGSGSRFALLTWLMPAAVAPVVAALILTGVAVAVARSSEAQAPWHGAALVVGAGLILTSPTYTWYALLLVVLVGLGARPEWLAVAALGYVAQYSGELGLGVTTAQRLAYGAALGVVAIGWRMRRRAGLLQPQPAG